MLGYLNTCISLESHTLLEVADFSDFRNQKSREKSVVFDLSQQLKDLLSAEGIKHNNQIDIEGYTNRLTSIKPNPPFSRRLLPLLGLRFLRSVGFNSDSYHLVRAAFFCFSNALSQWPYV